MRPLVRWNPDSLPSRRTPVPCEADWTPSPSVFEGSPELQQAWEALGLDDAAWERVGDVFDDATLDALKLAFEFDESDLP